MLRDKTIFALLAAALLGVGLSLIRFAPVVMTPSQGLWLVLECLALPLLFFLKEYRSDIPALRALAASRRAAWAFMLAALVLDFAVLVYGECAMGARRYLFLGGFGLRVSSVSFLLVMAFVSLRLGQRPAGRCEFLATLTALAAHFFLLLHQPDFTMFLIQLVCLFVVGFLGESQKNQKILLAATPTVFLLSLACLFVSAYRRQRLFIWLEPASDPYGAGYQLGQMLRTFRAAGLWGAENAAAFQDRLVLSKDPVLNALPYLARLWGNVTVAVCVALLLALMWILLRRVACLENPILRNGAFGVWVFLALTQLGGVCAPLGLLPMSNTWGLAFVGSQSLGGLLLLLAGVCWAAPATGSGGIGAFLRRGFFCWRKEMQSGVDTRLLADAWRFAARRRQGQNDPGAELPELPDLTHTGLVLIHLAAALEKAPSPDANLACGCAILHDAAEDTETTVVDIEARFGARIAAGVAALTQDKSLGEAELEDSLKRIRTEPPEIALVKLADRLAKLGEAPAHWTPARCLAYADESETILKALGKASPLLATQLRERIAAWRGEQGSENGGATMATRRGAE